MIFFLSLPSDKLVKSKKSLLKNVNKKSFYCSFFTALHKSSIKAKATKTLKLVLLRLNFLLQRFAYSGEEQSAFLSEIFSRSDFDSVAGKSKMLRLIANKLKRSGFLTVHDSLPFQKLIAFFSKISPLTFFYRVFILLCAF